MNGSELVKSGIIVGDALCHNELLEDHATGALLMSRPTVWATKVAALIQAGNSAAALAQIKVAPTVKDLQQLRAILNSAKLLARHPNVDAATQDMITALSSPRLHRSP
jgi:hypothetical protein